MAAKRREGRLLERILLRDCSYVITRDGVIADTSILVEDGVVKAIGDRLSGSYNVVECRGYIVLPCPFDGYSTGVIGRGVCGGLKPSKNVHVVKELRVDGEWLKSLGVRVQNSCSREEFYRLLVYASISREQVYLFKRRLDLFPIEALEKYGVLTPCTVLYNPVWVSSWELGLIAEHGSMAVLSPTGWLSEPGGFFPLMEARAKDIIVGIGSGEEGADVWLEAALLYFQASSVYGKPLDPRLVIEALIHGSAVIAGVDAKPYIEEDAPARLAMVRIDEYVEKLVERHGVLGALVRQGSGLRVKTLDYTK